jgi:hypothetical protein
MRHEPLDLSPRMIAEYGRRRAVGTHSESDRMSQILTPGAAADSRPNASQQSGSRVAPPRRMRQEL